MELVSGIVFKAAPTTWPALFTALASLWYPPSGNVRATGKCAQVCQNAVAPRAERVHGKAVPEAEIWEGVGQGRIRKACHGPSTVQDRGEPAKVVATTRVEIDRKSTRLN